MFLKPDQNKKNKNVSLKKNIGMGCLDNAKSALPSPLVFGCQNKLKPN